jgi:hypothetical protein
MLTLKGGFCEVLQFACHQPREIFTNILVFGRQCVKYLGFATYIIMHSKGRRLTLYTTVVLYTPPGL